MPKELEDSLKREYEAKGKSGKDLNHAIFGTMNRLGAVHGNKITAKGIAMDRKHAAMRHAMDKIGRKS